MSPARRPAVFAGLALAWAGIIFLASSSPSPFPFVPRAFLSHDKLIHLAVYALLGGLVRPALEGTRLRPGPALLLAGLLAAAYGATDELHQSFVPGRDGSLADLLADAAGSFLGAWSAALILRRQGREASIRD